jgi:hypothetical protein
MIFFSAVTFLQFLLIKILDPDWIRNRMGIQPKMLDPDQDLIESGSETLLQGYKPL